MVAGPTDAASILDGLREYEDEADLPSIPAFYRRLRKAVDAGRSAIEGIEPPSEGRGRPPYTFRLRGLWADQEARGGMAR